VYDDQAATAECWPRTVAILRHPSILRDLPACREAEEQDQSCVFGAQRALRFHASAEFFVEPLNRVRRP